MGNDISKMTSMDFDLYFNQHKILEISPKFYERLKKYVMEFGYPEKSIKIKKGQNGNPNLRKNRKIPRLVSMSLTTNGFWSDSTNTSPLKWNMRNITFVTNSTVS